MLFFRAIRSFICNPVLLKQYTVMTVLFLLSLMHINLAHANDIAILLSILRGEEKNLTVIEQFITTHKWAAEAMPNKFNAAVSLETPAASMSQFIKLLPITTQTSKALLHESALRSNHNAKASAAHLKHLETIWRDNILSEALERYLVAKYAKQFSHASLEHKTRIFIMAKKDVFAKNITSYMSPDQKKTYTNLIKAMTHELTAYKLANDTSLSQDVRAVANYLHIKQELKKKNDSAVISMLLKAQYIEFPSEWWKLKHIAIRNALRDKEYLYALEMAQSSHSLTGNDLFDAKWISGFILFRLLGKPLNSLPYFNEIYNIARTSHSKAQGAYWLGRAHQAVDEISESQNWFAIAASYNHYFYGQLASLELSDNTPEYARSLPKAPQLEQKQLQTMTSTARQLYNAGMKTEAVQILSYIANQGIEISAFNELTSQYFQQNEQPMLIALSKYLGNCGYPMVKDSYPTDTDLSQRECGHDRSFYLSIMRQESGFDPDALSTAGAHGLMQLMPATAEKYAKMMGLKKSTKNRDDNTNIAIGTYYLYALMHMWDHNYIMSIASYNAGENAVSRWVSEYGDPRNMKTLYETLDWVELIPYSETRLYVKKIIENMINYDTAILKHKHGIDCILYAFNINFIK